MHPLHARAPLVRGRPGLFNELGEPYILHVFVP